jgi:hypothetical protein
MAKIHHTIKVEAQAQPGSSWTISSPLTEKISLLAEGRNVKIISRDRLKPVE